MMTVMTTSVRLVDTVLAGTLVSPVLSYLVLEGTKELEISRRGLFNRV